ncbi:hypothetical protein [Sphingorhabdus profundilacus]|uniref:hypothetical protein n=1 Tax=Sphingorhabdus profundilacus TaxID=2509718 RepID=UPI00136575B7
MDDADVRQNAKIYIYQLFVDKKCTFTDKCACTARCIRLNWSPLLDFDLLVKLRCGGASILIAIVAFLTCFISLPRQFPQRLFTLSYFAATIFVCFRLTGSEHVRCFGNDLDGRSNHISDYGCDTSRQQKSQNQ